MRHLFLLLSVFVLAACASAEGPGSLDTLSPASQQQQAGIQTVPAAGAVSSQTLAAPGQQTFQPSAQSQFPAGQATQPNTLGTPNTSGTPNTLGTPGQISTAPSTQGNQTTLQDFSRIEPRPILGNDPFADQRDLNNQFSLDQPSTQQSLQDAVQAGLQQPTQAAPILAPVQPQFPRVALAPISTAPEPNATQLFDAIDDASFDRGMQFVFFGDESAQFVVRSQVSAIPSDSVTSFIYVFDVFDARGTLRHRVSGARAIPRSGPDGWALVDINTMQSVADDVAGRLLAWLSQNVAG